jgi:hypothetical protein
MKWVKVNQKSSRKRIVQNCLLHGKKCLCWYKKKNQTGESKYEDACLYYKLNCCGKSNAGIHCLKRWKMWIIWSNWLKIDAINTAWLELFMEVLSSQIDHCKAQWTIKYSNTLTLLDCTGPVWVLHWHAITLQVVDNSLGWCHIWISIPLLLSKSGSFLLVAVRVMNRATTQGLLMEQHWLDTWVWIHKGILQCQVMLNM